jgi:hypothetical protein
MLNVCDVGNLCHEHLEFYTLSSLNYLFGKHGLEIFDIETNDINGQSYRIYARHYGARKPKSADGHGYRRLIDAFMAEAAIKVNTQYFFEGIEENGRAVNNEIERRNELGRKVWVYGASTKGNTLLQYWGLNKEHFIGAVDKSPEKWGKVTVGTDIPIYSPQEFHDMACDYALILPYAFTDEFIKNEANASWRKAGGRFIKPLPRLEIL